MGCYYNSLTVQILNEKITWRQVARSEQLIVVSICRNHTTMKTSQQINGFYWKWTDKIYDNGTSLQSTYKVWLFIYQISTVLLLQFFNELLILLKKMLLTFFTFKRYFKKLSLCTSLERTKNLPSFSVYKIKIGCLW